MGESSLNHLQPQFPHLSSGSPSGYHHQKPQVAVGGTQGSEILWALTFARTQWTLLGNLLPRADEEDAE